MIDVSNRVFTNVKNYIKDICTNVSSDSSKSPPEFPASSIEQIDNADSALDLENSENATTSVIEINSFSNLSITEAKSIISKECDAMRIMGYVRTYGPKKIENVSDTNIYRMVARFKRLVTSVDDIERFKS